MRKLESARLRGATCQEIISFDCPGEKGVLDAMIQIQMLRQKCQEVLAVIARAGSIEQLFGALLVFPFPSPINEPFINGALRMKPSVLDMVLKAAMQRLMEIQKDAPEPN